MPTSKTPRPPKPNIVAEVYRQSTMLRSKEKFGVRIIAPNQQILFSSEKYHNRTDALHAADLLATGKITVVDTT